MDNRQAIERLYNDTCTVKVLKYVKDPVTRVEKSTEVNLIENEKCRISFTTIAPAENGIVSAVKQVTKLFVSPDIEIPSGSKIEVTRRGRTTEYCRSGEPAMYDSHQEIPLELFKEYA